MPRRNYSWIFGLTVWLLPIPAYADSFDATASADWLLPPIETWALWLTLIFLLISLIGSLTRARLSGIPSFTRAFIVVIVLFLTGAGLIGLWLMVVLALPLIIYCVGVFKAHLRSEVRRFDLFKVLALAVVACFMVLGALSIHTRLTRTSTDYAIKWAHTAPGRLTMEAMAAEGRSALPQFRRIAAEVKPRNSGVAIDVIARFGDPEQDVSILIDVLRRAEGETFSVRDIEAALTKLTGLGLPPGSNYVRWHNAWKKKRTPVRPKVVTPASKTTEPKEIK